MPESAVYSITHSEQSLEVALSGLYREAQEEARQRPRVTARRLDFVLTMCNTATWLYTATALIRNI